MTTNTAPDLNLLAEDPRAFDTEVARLSADRDKARDEIARATARLHELAGDRKRYRNTRVPVWGMTDLQVEKLAQRAAVHGDQQARVVLTSRAAAQVMAEAITDELLRMDNAYTGWTRFFPSITKSQPHIHRSLNCRTLHATTVMRWAPELSGHTEATAVEKLDEALCSVCFPDAPVALHEYVSQRSQADQAARLDAQSERAAAKRAKQLTTDEQFTMGRDRHGDHVTTVAKLKEIVRDAIELEVEDEFWATHSPAGWDAEALLRRRTNTADSLTRARADAAKAEALLLAREAAHEGWGATAEAIAKMRASKRESARRGWAKV